MPSTLLQCTVPNSSSRPSAARKKWRRWRIAGTCCLSEAAVNPETEPCRRGLPAGRRGQPQHETSRHYGAAADAEDRRQPSQSLRLLALAHAVGLTQVGVVAAAIVF